MGTAEILIVFSALMALIALVTIGIDWIGKPLKNRRFIPRIYRFDDEKLPVDAYGNTAFGNTAFEPAQPVPAQPVPAQPVPRQVALVPRTSQTAFSDSLARSGNGGAGRNRAMIAGTEPTPTAAPARSSQWAPGMPLDTSVDGRKPSLATKAERFWMATAEAIGSIATSHFDDDDVERMAAGKAPRRENPRTGRPEAMQLTGLRRASSPADVGMRWPDDSVDPWNS